MAEPLRLIRFFAISGELDFLLPLAARFFRAYFCAERTVSTFPFLIKRSMVWLPSANYLYIFFASMSRALSRRASTGAGGDSWVVGRSSWYASLSLGE